MIGGMARSLDLTKHPGWTVEFPMDNFEQSANIGDYPPILETHNPPKCVVTLIPTFAAHSQSTQ